MHIKRLIKTLRVKKTYAQFTKNCVYGDRLGLDFTSKCISAAKNNIQIGSGCEIKGTLYSCDKGTIHIGDNLYMGYNSFIGAVESVYIGNDVIIASNVRIFDNNNHPTDPEKRREMSHSDFYGDLWSWTQSDHKAVVLNDNVWVGEYSAILKGVVVGEGSIIASHSVVTKDVPPYSIVAGNPAKVVKTLSKPRGTE
ncbi:TPA: hypothetical protein ACGPAS_001050 [Streptococcus suis]